MAKEMEWDELDRSIWAYRIPLGSVCGIIMGGLALYFVPFESVDSYHGSGEPFTTFVLGGFVIGLAIGFGIADLVRKWVNRNTIKTVRYRD